MSEEAPWEDIEWAIPERPVREPEFLPMVEAAIREVDPSCHRDLYGRLNISDPNHVTKAQELAFIALGIPYHKGSWEEYDRVVREHGYTEEAVVG